MKTHPVLKEYYRPAFLAGLVLLLGLAAPASASRHEPELYTLVNLHPDEGRQWLYSVNYQQRGLIPLCTKIRILEEAGSSFTFEIADTGRRYVYQIHDSLRMPVTEHRARYFGTSCDRTKVERLSEVDRKGIEAGRARPGMSKDGVIFAIGYPPEHATPSLDADVWKYWRSRMRTMLVHFAGGVVARIEE